MLFVSDDKLPVSRKCDFFNRGNSQMWHMPSAVILIKKHPNTNAKQSQGIRQRMQSDSKWQNEQLPVSPFQRDSMQTKSTQEEVRGNWVV